ncbi:glycosyltransferase family 4 protein [Neorhizobium alkalisoli]|uniref:Glycosyltransferase involved in cell wall biosynthesis n=1 Tax=Neorhizobium alkalisoli TaxID=528178 RepID=A0A561R3C2_9HYPH|nr:glycosyltransferase family 4 protein [Neorhizobium alkalisoli]TWF57125.1 glycosyltransferase involved in cell wall biosynthesis [Neorhizobium alkalisoli]
MNIAFYAPLKSPRHPVPSGDRLMARQLLEALRLARHAADVVSEFRAFLPDATSPTEERDAQAEAEITRISTVWEETGTPDRWVTYHPYYKAPDLIGPNLCRRFGVPYLTVETSYSNRRNRGQWIRAQELVAEGARQATVNICITERDAHGLREVIPEARLARISPFIDPALYLVHDPVPQLGKLMTVAMMRPGDKLSSYTALAESLSRIGHLDWALSIIGDGPARAEVEALFENLPEGRIEWLGQREPAEIAKLLSTASLYVWPGHGEAYGLAYLEAQAAGLPVVAEAVAGVSEAVANGRSGILTPGGDRDAYAMAIARLLEDQTERQKLAGNARDFILSERSITAAATRLNDIITNCGDMPA